MNNLRFTGEHHHHNTMVTALNCLDDESLQSVAVQTLNTKIIAAKGKLLGMSLPWQIADALQLGRETATDIISHWYKLYVYSFIVDDSFDQSTSMNKENFFASAILFASGTEGLQKYISEERYRDLFAQTIKTSFVSEWNDLENEYSDSNHMIGKNSPILLPIYSMLSNSDHPYKDSLIPVVQSSLYFFQILDDITDLSEDISNDSTNYILTRYSNAFEHSDCKGFSDDKIWEVLLNEGMHEEIFLELAQGFNKISASLSDNELKGLAEVFKNLEANCAETLLTLRHIHSSLPVSNLSKKIRQNINAMIASS